ncbi:Protein of unknown function [Bacillus mycoides]|nr:Protein of unknown function [Bacillus mycoides]
MSFINLSIQEELQQYLVE